MNLSLLQNCHASPFYAKDLLHMTSQLGWQKWQAVMSAVIAFVAVIVASKSFFVGDLTSFSRLRDGSGSAAEVSTCLRSIDVLFLSWSFFSLSPWCFFLLSLWFFLSLSLFLFIIVIISFSERGREICVGGEVESERGWISVKFGGRVCQVQNVGSICLGR